MIIYWQRLSLAIMLGSKLRTELPQKARTVQIPGFSSANYRDQDQLQSLDRFQTSSKSETVSTQDFCSHPGLVIRRIKAGFSNRKQLKLEDLRDLAGIEKKEELQPYVTWS